jgi:hypothetical protein
MRNTMKIFIGFELDTRRFLRVLGPKINEENQGRGPENLNAIPRD